MFIKAEARELCGGYQDVECIDGHSSREYNWCNQRFGHFRCAEKRAQQRSDEYYPILNLSITHNSFTVWEAAFPCEEVQSHMRRLMDRVRRAIKSRLPRKSFVLSFQRFESKCAVLRVLYCGPDPGDGRFKRRLGRIGAWLVECQTYNREDLHPILDQFLYPWDPGTPTLRAHYELLFDGMDTIRIFKTSELFTGGSNPVHKTTDLSQPHTLRGQKRRSLCPHCRKPIVKRGHWHAPERGSSVRRL
jgi:hypothetical protein